MSLKDRLTKPPAAPSKQFCTVGRVLQQLVDQSDGMMSDPQGDYMALVRVLADRAWKAGDIKQILAEEGYEVDSRHLTAHRRGDHEYRQCVRWNAGTFR